jgi:pyrimidine operon attenuation protein/uracil phosphoribosyltransferase
MSPSHPDVPLPDAEAQCRALADALKPVVNEHTAFVGIFSGGVWIAEKVSSLLGLTAPVGQIDVSFYRDDYETVGLHHNVRPTSMPFPVEARHIVLFDDVLESGRTTRAALNVLFDYGRPACVDLAVLADRGGRQLPIAARWCVWQPTTAPNDSLILDRDEAGRLSWRMEKRGENA